MKNRNYPLTLVIGCLAASLLANAMAQDWPQWRGANRDAKAGGFNAPKSWPKELIPKWKVTVGQGDATPALVGGGLYVFARQDMDEVTRCLDAATGKELWQDKYSVEKINGPDAAVHGGPRSSPAVANGKVVTLGVCGKVSCLDAATGKMLWRKEDFGGTWPRFHTATSPLILENVCIVQLGKESEGAIVAYDLGSGDQKWKWTGDGPGYSSPAVLKAEGATMIVTLTAKNIVGVSATDGKLLWQIPFAPQGMAYNAATPIVDGQTVIYFGQGRGARAVKVEKEGDTFAAKEVWNNPDNAIQFNSPVLKNGLIFGLSQKGNYFCLNAQSGKTAWADAAGGRGGFGCVVDAGPVLFGLTSKSQLTAFEPTEKEYVELASLKVADKQTYAYPVVSGNRLFIRDQDSIALFSFE